MRMIDALKGIATDKLSLDELIERSVEAKLLAAEYVTVLGSEPEWLSDAKRVIATAITRQTTDRIALELREIKQQEEALKTAAEKREALAKRKAELESKLGQPVGA